MSARPLRALREDPGLTRRAALSAWLRPGRLGQLETFCLFVGHPRSGHSLVGALLDAQPDASIAHELDVLGFLEAGERRRARLLSLCLERSRWFARRGAQWNEFSYEVPGGWQGRARRLRVIGDKKGGRTTIRLRRRPELLDELSAAINAPVRLIHVVRHPLDNIATMCVRRGEPLTRTIEEYFDRAEALQRILAAQPSHAHRTLTFEAFSESPTAHLHTLTTFLDLPQDPVAAAATTAAATIVRPVPSRSRARVEWTSALLNEVRRRTDGISHLRCYADDATCDWSPQDSSHDKSV